MNVGDAGVFYHSEEYIFPSDKGGVKSKIIMKMEEAEFDEDDNEKETPINQKTDEKTFIWDGKTLSQILKLKYKMKKNKIIAVIPARYEASRFPGKLMQLLGEKTVIATTYKNVVETGLFD